MRFLVGNPGWPLWPASRPKASTSVNIHMTFIVNIEMFRSFETKFALIKLKKLPPLLRRIFCTEYPLELDVRFSSFFHRSSNRRLLSWVIEDFYLESSHCGKIEIWIIRNDKDFPLCNTSVYTQSVQTSVQWTVFINFHHVCRLVISFFFWPSLPGDSWPPEMLILLAGMP